MKSKYLPLFVVLFTVFVLFSYWKTRTAVIHLLLGWIVYLTRVLPEVTVGWDGIATFVVGIFVFTLLLHNIAAWLRWEMSGQTLFWKWRSTFTVVGLVIMMFVSGIAMIGVTHQSIWLATQDESLMEPVMIGQYMPVSSGSNLKEMGFGIRNFYENNNAMPSLKRSEKPEHSWVTQSIPFKNYSNEMDEERAWDHPDNQLEIRKLVPELLNPELRPLVLRDENGYGVSHYAGNTHLFDQPQPVKFSIIKDGLSNTVMVGEVNSNFQPWAKPGANRDPALGLNRSPDGFGGPRSRNKTMFLTGDGSVRSFSNDIDPTVLKALGTPAGGEGIDPDQWDTRSLRR